MRTAVAFIVSIGLGALFLPACELAQSDVVVREPAPPKAAGGAAGQDTTSFPVPSVDAGEAGSAAESPDAAMSLDGSAPAEAGAGEVLALFDIAYRPLVDVADAVQPDLNLQQLEEACSGDAFAFCDNFDPGSGLWTESGGKWAIREDSSWGDTEAYGPTLPVASQAYVPSLVLGDMTAEARVFVTSFGQPSSVNRVELFARYQDSSHNYSVSLSADGKVGLRKNGSGLGTPASISIVQGQWHTLKIRVSGLAGAVVVEGSLDGDLLATISDSGPSSIPSGTVAVGVYGASLAVFDEVRVSVP
jgi:hypothetical protein